MSAKRRQIALRHASNDRIVALIELVFRGTKAHRANFYDFVKKSGECLRRGYHLLIVDLFPPTRRDPHGIHAAIWETLTDETSTPPVDGPLTLVAYSAGPIKKAYLEPTAVGRELIEMRLFLEPDIYVNVPLEETYREACRGIAKKMARRAGEATNRAIFVGQS